MEVRAIARRIGIPPRKVRLVIETVKGRKVSEALALLRHIPNAAAKPIETLIDSAVANAENNYALDVRNLYIVQIVADPAPTMHKFRIQSRRGASRLNKRASHITVIVSDEYDLIPQAFRGRHAR